MGRLKLMKPTVAPGRYRHYKGQDYEVIGLVRHSETLEEMVLYKPLYKNKTASLWVRPKDMFLESVEHEGGRVPRFQKID